MNCRHYRQEVDGLVLPCATPGCAEGHREATLYTVKRSIYSAPCYRGEDWRRAFVAGERKWVRRQGFLPGSDRMAYWWKEEEFKRSP